MIKPYTLFVADSVILPQAATWFDLKALDCTYESPIILIDSSWNEYDQIEYAYRLFEKEIQEKLFRPCWFCLVECRF
ncbi:MAG: hypothetical protein IKC69_05035 [Clostridia bacterium]|nr:hypothetical protein [Clostridia bacterium]